MCGAHFTRTALSNVLWIAWGWHDRAWALIVLQAGLLAMNVRGARENDAVPPKPV